MLPIDSFVNELIGRKSCASKGSYCWDLPDELAGILCTIILFGTLRGRSPSPLRFFPKTCFGKIHSILVTHFVVMNFSFFHSHGCSIFSLMDFNLPRVTGRFQFTFKFIWITCCQVKKQMKTGEKNNPCVRWEIFLSKQWRKRMQTLHFSIYFITPPFIPYRCSVKIPGLNGPCLIRRVKCRKI